MNQTSVAFTRTSTKKLIVVIPAFNEADQIGETLSRLHQIQGTLSKYGTSLISYVVDDGSSDNTRQLAQNGGAHRVLFHRVNQGLGAAVRTGLKAAYADGADIAVKMDSDLQHNAGDIERLIQPLLNDEADIVYGNRFENISYKMPMIRWLGNKIFTTLMRSLTHWPLKDSQPGIFAVSRAYLENFHIPGDYNYTQQILLDAYHKGMRFQHVAVSFHPRTKGRSFISLQYPIAALTQILMVLVGLKPLRVFMPIGLVFLFIGMGISGWELLAWIQGNSHKPIIHVNAVLGSFFFGLQTFFFGILAQLIVTLNRK